MTKRFCKMCHTELPPYNKGGRQPVYCGPKCANKWRNNHGKESDPITVGKDKLLTMLNKMEKNNARACAA